jgi:hypothetical protein
MRSPSQRASRSRLHRWCAALAVGAVVLGLAPGTAQAREDTPTEPDSAPAGTITASNVATPRILFPVDGPVYWTDTFGACRGTGCERTHQGQDLMGKKLQPLLAARSGVVSRVSDCNCGLSGNSVTIRAKDGWSYVYIHINNDSPGTDDGRNPNGWVLGRGIELGAKVKQGQIVGYLGDSGNAEGTSPHLHFEIHTPSGAAINGAEALRNAKRWKPGPRWSIHDSFSGNGPSRWFPSRAKQRDRPLACDLTGNGRDQPVLFRRSAPAQWLFRTNTKLGGKVYLGPTFGKADDLPVCGDWNGDGTDTIGVFRNGEWRLSDSNETIRIAHRFTFGTEPGDQPVVGDWNGDGRDEPGIYRPGEGSWYLRKGVRKASGERAPIRFGAASDVAVVGDWNQDGISTIGVVRGGEWRLSNSLTAARSHHVVRIPRAAGDTPVPGSWNGKRDRPGVHRATPFG